jgi:hypothetical protein
VELVLALASVDLRYKVDRATTGAFGLRIQTWGFANVARSTAASGEFAVDRLALDAFADDTSVCVYGRVRANVSNAWYWLATNVCATFALRRRLTSTASRVNRLSSHFDSLDYASRKSKVCILDSSKGIQMDAGYAGIRTNVTARPYICSLTEVKPLHCLYMTQPHVPSL